MQNDQRCPCGATFVSHSGGAKYVCGGCGSEWVPVREFVCIDGGKHKNRPPQEGDYAFSSHMKDLAATVKKLTGHVGRSIQVENELRAKLGELRAAVHRLTKQPERSAADATG